MKTGITLGLRMKWSAFLTAPITCTLLAGLLLTAPDRALATTDLQFDRSYAKAGPFSGDYSSIFRDLKDNGKLDRTEWQSGTFLKNFLEKQNTKDHSNNGISSWRHEDGFMNNKHENAILFGNHQKGLLNQKNDRHYEKHHNVVPIPASAWLFCSAIGLLGWSKRRKA